MRKLTAVTVVVVTSLLGWPGAGSPAHASAGSTSSPAGAAPLQLAAASAHPVNVTEFALRPGGSASAPTTSADGAPTLLVDHDAGNGRMESASQPSGPFQTIALSWPTGAAHGPLGIQLRTHTALGWGDWITPDPADASVDSSSADGKHQTRGGSEPIWVGESDAIQVSSASARPMPAGVRVVLIGSPRLPTSSIRLPPVGGAAPKLMSVGPRRSVTTVVATVAPLPTPAVITRAEWQAADPACDSGSATRLKAAVVHHTAGSNNYTTVAEAMQQIRNDQAYHMQVRGWCDLGYNFVVDHFGNVYEGRAGSLDSAKIGAHASGFNDGSVGVSLLGTFSTVTPPEVMLRAAAWIIGYRLGTYSTDPAGTATFTISATAATIFPPGTTVTLPAIMAHRDVYSTECPGSAAYALLGEVRSRAVRAKTGVAFAATLYQDLLGRPADPIGLKSWSRSYEDGLGAGPIVSAMANSNEYRARRISAAYRLMLGRSVDPIGLASWVSLTGSGAVPIDSLPRQLAMSDEFLVVSGGQAGAVARLYTTMLGRTASAADVSSWSAVWNRSGRAAAVDGIWNSTEAREVRVATYYRAFLNREPDRSGQVLWGSVLGTSGEPTVRAGIGSSAESVQTSQARIYG